MNRRWILFTPLLIVFSIGVILYTAIGKDPTKLETARLNDPLPKFALPTLANASEIVTQAKIKGEPSLLNVWATWCPSCRVEHDYLNKLSAEGIRIVGLNYKDDREDANAWLAQLGNPYAFNIYDPDGKLGFDLGVYGAPETYLVDSNGFVRYRHVGVVNDDVWKGTLKPLMDKYSQ